MDANLKSSLWEQFGAAIDVLIKDIDTCPDHLWMGKLWQEKSEGPGYSEFWYLAFHCLFWLDFYLTGSREGFIPPSPFTLSEFSSTGFPERAYTKEELMAYARHGRAKCREMIEGLTDKSAAKSFRFRWGEISYLGLLLYNMRHVQEHATQLSLYLGQNGISAPGWVTKAIPG